MKNLKKNIAVVLMVMAMMVMSAIPVFAAKISLYEEEGDDYVPFSFSDTLDSIEDLGDDGYEVYFKEFSVYGQPVFIQTISINGEHFTADEEGSMVSAFEYQPENMENGMIGNPFWFQIGFPSGATYPVNEGVLVITE